MHIPVLRKEVIEFLKPKPGKNFVDCTLGEGGHGLAILEKISPSGKLIGIERDPEILEKTKLKIENCFETNGWNKGRIIFVCDNFSNLKSIIENRNFKTSGFLFDLGFSSWHMEESNRGFSFRKEEELDMRYNPKENNLTARKIINEFPREDIEKIIKEYGEERFCKRIASKIIEERKRSSIETTKNLVEVLRKATPSWYHHKRIHFATRTFQALRIAVNDELNSFEKGLSQAFDILEPSGRILVISFHSLEDRITKNFFKNKVKEGLLKIITKKPIRPSGAEIETNPRSRSAKLRVGEKNNV
jgi:16S rRNA (cytosine1402-N4)-methyltransferase